MKIVVIDDDALVVTALRTIIESNGYTVVGVGNRGEDAIDLFHKHHPDLLMMDIRMGEMNGIDASREILNTYQDANILLVTTFDDQKYIQEALDIGVKGYLLKDNFNGILPAIEAVQSGNMVFDSKIIRAMNKKEIQSSKSFEALSKREIDILELVAEGLSNREISETLFISEGTVRNYISNMLAKLQLKGRTQLVVHYYKQM